MLALSRLTRSIHRSYSEIKNVVVIGSGIMGSGICQTCVMANIDVTLIDKSNDALNNSLANIKKSLTKIFEKKFPDNKQLQMDLVNNSIKKIKTSSSLDSINGDSHFIIEAVKEDLLIKIGLLKQVEKLCSDDAIIATNTSSLSVNKMNEILIKKNRFIGVHFFNPVVLMKLVEVIRSRYTDDTTETNVFEFLKKIHKTPVKCKDTAGFIVNRLLIPYLIQAIDMYERNDASKEDIDIAMKLGTGYPMGPFELADYVGLDTLQSIIKGWKENFPNDKIFSTSRTLDMLVSSGKLGKKTGEGFYKYK